MGSFAQEYDVTEVGRMKPGRKNHTQFPQIWDGSSCTSVLKRDMTPKLYWNFHSSSVKNSVSHSQPRFCVLLSSWLCHHKSLHEAGRECRACAPASTGCHCPAHTQPFTASFLRINGMHEMLLNQIPHFDPQTTKELHCQETTAQK